MYMYIHNTVYAFVLVAFKSRKSLYLTVVRFKQKNKYTKDRNCLDTCVDIHTLLINQDFHITQKFIHLHCN